MQSTAFAGTEQQRTSMARIIYALSGQGRGHTSRVMAVSEVLRQRGHEVVFCCGGTARAILEERGERVIPVPALRQVMRANKVRLGRTVGANWRTVLSTRAIVADLAGAFSAERADLLISDFEAFAPRAARRIGLPVLSFNHQQVVTETHHRPPVQDWPAAALTSLAVRAIAPRHAAEHVLLTSFFYPALKHPERTTLVPPIIRPAVQRLRPRRTGPALVYYNQTTGAEAEVLRALRQVDAPFVLYNFEAPPNAAASHPNLTFKKPSLEGFLRDLAVSRAVICTAGFTLISEALYLGKPLLVVPNGGIFEQIINARFLVRDGLGEAVTGRPLAARDVEALLGRAEMYAERLRRFDACGNAAAADCIERLLARRPVRKPAAGRFAAPAAAPLAASLASLHAQPFLHTSVAPSVP